MDRLPPYIDRLHHVVSDQVEARMPHPVLHVLLPKNHTFDTESTTHITTSVIRRYTGNMEEDGTFANGTSRVTTGLFKYAPSPASGEYSTNLVLAEGRSPGFSRIA